MKVLLTGGTGQIGQEILTSKPQDTQIISPNSNKLDLSDYNACKKIVKDHNPDWIINCGAYTSVDRAEKDIELSYKINSFAPKAFAEALNEINGNLLQLSTDYVFDGEQNSPYEVHQEKNPISQYGQSKALGEELIEKNIKNIRNATILRTSWVISPRGKNFILTMLKLHSEKEYIKVVSDQIGSPTCAKELSKVCWKIVELKKKNKLPFILQWSDAGIASWFDIAVAVGEIGLDLGILKKKAYVYPIYSYEYPTSAKRPKYSLLNTSKTSKYLKIQANHWRENLVNILTEYKNANKI